MAPVEVIGDSARGEEYASVRLLVDGDRIVDADAAGLERPLAGLSLAGTRVALLALLMAVLWVTEAVPIPATSLLPLVLLPLLGISPIRQAAAPYADPIIYLFMGGFMLALAMERWNLHRRIALAIISTVGTRPRALVLGFLAAAAFIIAYSPLTW